MSALLRNLLFPPRCIGCGEVLRVPDYRRGAPDFCPACAEKWARETAERCGICGREAGDCACVTEDMLAAHIATFRKLAYYRQGRQESVQNRMVYRIKEARDRRTVGFFADGLSRIVTELLRENGWRAADCALVWLPRGNRKRLATGTDQARELARGISARTGIPAAGLIERVPGEEREQKTLSLSERRRNARAAFRLSGRVGVPRSAHIFLVDDIVTTGSGMAAGARLLRRAKYGAPVALAALSDDGNRYTHEKQPVIDLEKQRKK